MEEDPVLALVKFGAAEHMADLCTHGHLYMQSVAYFRGLDADAARSDVHEGLRYCYQASNTIFQVRVGRQLDDGGGYPGTDASSDRWESSRQRLLHVRSSR